MQSSASSKRKWIARRLRVNLPSCSALLNVPTFFPMVIRCAARLSKSLQVGSASRPTICPMRTNCRSKWLSTPNQVNFPDTPRHYSIEDLKQSIYDQMLEPAPVFPSSLFRSSEVGVGIVASGVAKAKAGCILFSGHDDGTGASK